MSETVIIGAGMAGLTCARVLADAGCRVRVLDKGRDIGGRMATRRVATELGELRFDHGAQYVTAREPGFTALLADLPGAVARWDNGTAHAWHVGTPGMSDLPRAMAAGLDVRQGVEVTGLQATDRGWRITAGEDTETAEHVVLTVPAPQVGALIGADHPLTASLQAVTMAPCLTLMAAFPGDAPAPFASRKPDGGPLAWIAQDSTKPGRPATATTWVAQASPGWSAAHRDEDKGSIVARMLPLLCAAIGTVPDAARHVAAHRWRYARVTTSLGQPFLRDATGTLHLGGDWCLGARVEAAWQSGAAIARDILEGGESR